MRWDFDYTRDEPPVVQRLTDEPRHSTPRADQRTPIERPRPALELPRPRASSAPPTSHPAKRMALNYAPVTEEITPPVTPPRAQTKEINTVTETVPETPSPTPKPGRSRGRGTWRAPQKIAPGVGTRSKTRAAELERRDAAQAQAAHARWPPSPDATEGIQELTRELRISDVPRNVHKELQTTATAATAATASSGWTDDTASEHLLHPSTSRCWWREGEFGPSEYGNAGADPTPGSITCSAASRGSSIDDDTGYQTQSIQHHAPHQGWHARPVGFTPTVGGSDATPR